MSHMERREFIALVGGGGLLLTVKVRRARGQQPTMPVVGFVSAGSSDAPLAAAFRKGLNEVGYFEGQNVTVEYHWLEGQFDRLPNRANGRPKRTPRACARLLPSSVRQPLAGWLRRALSRQARPACEAQHSWKLRAKSAAVTADRR
jgi:hypothetical protein